MCYGYRFSCFFASPIGFWTCSEVYFFLFFVIVLSLMEQELLTLPEHLSSSRFLWGSCFNFLCSILQITVCTLIVLFLLHIELSAIRITAFDYPFGILKLFSILCRKHIKGILKLILVIFCMSWKLAIGSINDIYETLTRFLSMKLCKSDIISW